MCMHTCNFSGLVEAFESIWVAIFHNGSISDAGVPTVYLLWEQQASWNRVLQTNLQ
jgi:hypothetical protein